MFLENFNIFEQIGILFSILAASLFFCVILQFFQVLRVVMYPISICCKLCCKCECRDADGQEINWDEYSLRCPCAGGEDDLA